MLEEARRVVAPGDVDGEEHVAQGPGHDHRVVSHDDEADEDLEPPQPLEPGGQTPEDRRWRAAEAVPQGVVEEEDRQPGRQQRDDVGDDEGTAAVGVGHTWKAPDVAQPDRRAEGGDEEAELTAPLLARGRLKRLALPCLGGHEHLP